MKRWTIYTLSDPRTEEPRYVGATTYDLRKRLGEHMSPSCPWYTPRARWIAELRALGLRATIEPLYVAHDARTAKALEVSTIMRFFGEGVLLVNAPEVAGSRAPYRANVVAQLARELEARRLASSGAVNLADERARRRHPTEG